MEIYAVGIAVQLLADALVGARLLWLAKRTRQLPELCFGLCCFLLGAVGMPLAMAVRGGALGAPEDFGSGLATALAIQNAACAALYVATWRVFRDGSRWGAGLAALGISALVASVPGSAADGGFWYWLGYGARGGAFVWSLAESIRYAGMLRRRLELGLGAPEVADRFCLWAICCGAVVLGFALTLVVKAQAVNPAETPWYLASVSAIGLIGAGSLWCAFAPPSFYLRRFAAASDS